MATLLQIARMLNPPAARDRIRAAVALQGQLVTARAAQAGMPAVSPQSAKLAKTVITAPQAFLDAFAVRFASDGRMTGLETALGQEGLDADAEAKLDATITAIVADLWDEVSKMVPAT